MEFRYQKLQQDFSALQAAFQTLGNQLAEAGKETSQGSVPSDIVAQGILAARTQFDGVRIAIETLAKDVLVANIPGSDQLKNLPALEGLLRAAVSAEDNKFEVETERERALALIDRVLGIHHRETTDFKPLVDCLASAKALRQAIEAAKWPDRHPDSARLLEDKLPFTHLLTLVASGGDLDDETWATLEESITTAFGRALGVAVSRGKLSAPAGGAAVQARAPKPVAVVAPKPKPEPVKAEEPPPAAAEAPKVEEAPKPEPVAEAPKVEEAPKPEPVAEAPKAEEAPKPEPVVEAPKVEEAPQVEAVAEAPAPAPEPEAEPVKAEAAAPVAVAEAPAPAPEPAPEPPKLEPAPVEVKVEAAKPAPKIESKPAAVAVALAEPPKEEKPSVKVVVAEAPKVEEIPVRPAKDATQPISVETVQAAVAAVDATRVVEAPPKPAASSAPRIATVAPEKADPPKPAAVPPKQPQAQQPDDKAATDSSGRPQRWGFWRGSR